MISPDNFRAGSHSGGLCYLCEKVIKAEEDVRYYGGPYVMHARCIDRIIEEHNVQGSPKPKGENPHG